jgi:protein-tyrosine-phosphatase
VNANVRLLSEGPNVPRAQGFDQDGFANPGCPMTDGQKVRPNVLFVCTGNTCRSVLAEYLGRQVFGDSVAFESAGIRPQPASDAENAIFTLRNNFGIDASGHVPRNIRTLNIADYDLIIALDKTAVRVVEDMGARPSLVKVWKVRDPWGPDLTEYDRASLEIKTKLVQLKASGARRHEA